MSESPPQSDARPYRSTLRERQVAQTRELILDAVTTLLADRRADEVSTRDIAAVAGVSERTVYRHFPDRDSLLDGLSRRLPPWPTSHRSEQAASTNWRRRAVA
jgi:AcrR family transcriptional regulator